MNIKYFDDKEVKYKSNIADEISKLEFESESEVCKISLVDFVNAYENTLETPDLKIQHDESGIQSVFGINFLSLYNSGGHTKESSFIIKEDEAYWDFVIFPSSKNCKSNFIEDSKFFQIELEHLKMNEFYNFIKDFHLKTNEDLFVLKEFYDYLDLNGVAMKILN